MLLSSLVVTSVPPAAPALPARPTQTGRSSTGVSTYTSGRPRPTPLRMPTSRTASAPTLVVSTLCAASTATAGLVSVASRIEVLKSIVVNNWSAYARKVLMAAPKSNPLLII